MKSCVVIFPLYQKPTELELSFLENGLAKTAGHKHIIVAPDDLIIDESFGLLQQLEVKHFSKKFFSDIAGYNRLLLSKKFYQAFIQYDFLLIHQADVFLFKAELNEWCAKDYDYIGAPFFRPEKLNRNLAYNLFQKIKLTFKKNKIYGSRHNKVGNGGLSLRKINSALQVLDKIDPMILNKYLQTKGCAFNEDIFWSFEAPLVVKLNIPNWEEALRFAVEFHPAVAYAYLGKKLPFGCHAPLKNNPIFWKKFISSL